MKEDAMDTNGNEIITDLLIGFAIFCMAFILGGYTACGFIEKNLKEKDHFTLLTGMVVEEYKGSEK